MEYCGAFEVVKKEKKAAKSAAKNISQRALLAACHTHEKKKKRIRNVHSMLVGGKVLFSFFKISP